MLTSVDVKFIAELHTRREARSPIAKEMWWSTHLRKFGNHVTVHRASERPSVRTTGIPM